MFHPLFLALHTHSRGMANRHTCGIPLNSQSCGFMYGELTDKETVARVEYALEHQQHDQFEILLYKKNSKFLFLSLFPRD